MEIKILCSCGVKYKLDVEPVNGRVPAPLSCPGCGASWTDFANGFIAQSLGLPPPVPTPSSASAFVPPAKSTLRVSAPAHVEAVPVIESQSAPPPTEASRRHIPNVPMLNPVLEPEVSGSRFLMGMLGAVL